MVQNSDGFPLRRAAATLLLIACASALAPGVPAQTSEDEAFLQALEGARPGDAVDSRRLAKVFFGVAATLQGNQSSVRLLQTALRPRDLANESVRAVVNRRYRGYAESVERFRHGVSSYLDRPDSAALLYRALSEGHLACWKLDAFVRVAETYGVGSSDFMTILSSSEACARFRRAAFAPAVEAIIESALDESDGLREEANVLREELEELERLLEDLQRIDAAE